MGKSTRVLGGIAVAALAAAGVAAVVNYRRGRRPGPVRQSYLEELDSRLEEAQEPDNELPGGRFGHVLANLQRTRGVSARQLRMWIDFLRRGSLSPEQATMAESDFAALERDADQADI